MSAASGEIDPTVRETTTITRTDRPLRRAAALTALVLAAAGGIGASTALWPLLIVPIVLAVPIAGWTGLAAVLVASSGLGAIVASRGASGAQVAVGLGAAAVGAVLAGARHMRVVRALDRVSGASLRDRLTGLYNYAYFSDALAQEHSRSARYGGPLSLVLFDIDHFKSFNDTHGHAAGNELLAAVGRVFAKERRSTDIVARFGGEEFALLVPGSADMAAEAAERVRRSVERLEIPVGGYRDAGRTISAGVAALRPDDTPEDLLERADRALYLSKGRGRNRVSVAADGADAPLRRAV